MAPDDIQNFTVNMETYALAMPKFLDLAGLSNLLAKNKANP